MFNWIHSLFSKDLAIDLGTANTIVYVKGVGIVANEPSVVAVQKGDYHEGKRVLAVGKEAKEMLGRTPGNIQAIRPMKDGVIADFESTRLMLRRFIQIAHNGKSLVKPRVVIGVPSKVTEVEQRAVREAAVSAGAREVYLIEQPMAAAIGAGLPIADATGNVIVDIGGGTTDVAVISLSGIVYSLSERVGGDKMNEAIIEYMKDRHEMIIGERTAENVKIRIGRACNLPEDEEETMEVKGQDQRKCIPCVRTVTSTEIIEALKGPVDSIAKALGEALENTPAELSGDIAGRGVILAGGGSLLKNLAAHLQEKVGLPVMNAEDPLQSVVRGAGKTLDDPEMLRHICQR